ncbi:MAG: hypothetical protein KAX80_08615 [Planctomycetes bacterium]|nr:hypothetical protein [Planctomycetota bacterium]
MTRRLLNVTRRSVRVLAAVLLCFCLLGAAGAPELTNGIIIAGGFLLALMGQGWALQRHIERKIDDRIQLHRDACHPATVEDLGQVRETLARVETRLDSIEKKLDRLTGEQ